MEYKRLSRFFFEQAQRMNEPDESREEYATRLVQTQQRSTRKHISKTAAHVETTPETSTTKLKTRHPNTGSEQKEPHTVRSESHSREPDMSRAISAPQSLKRKSPDKEPGLLKEGARPGKKTRRQIDEVGVSAHPRKPSAAQLASIRQTEEKMERAGARIPAAKQNEWAADGRDAKVPSPVEMHGNLRDPQQSGAIDSGHVKSRQKALVSNSDGDICVTKQSALKLRGLEADPGKESKVLALTLREKMDASSSRPAPKTVAAQKATQGRTEEAGSTASSQMKKAAASTAVMFPKSLTKPPPKIPRYSDIKRTYKDGRPKAPVDINSAVQSVREKRLKIEDKTLCDTGVIEMDAFIDRLHLFYDEEEMNRRKNKTKTFGGLVVFFCPHDDKFVGMNSRKKLQFLVAHGVTVVPIFHPERVTHVVVNDGVSRERQFLTRAGLKSIDEVPEHVPILRWEWVEQSERKRTLQPTHEFPAFDSRITHPPDYVPLPSEQPTPSTSKSAVQPEREARQIQKRRATHSDSEDSNGSSGEKISDWTKWDGRVTNTKPLTLKNNRLDPLAEFYDEARDEIDLEYLQGRSRQDGESVSEEESSSEPRGVDEAGKKGIFQCDRKPDGRLPGSCPNQDVIDTLAELKALHEAKATPDDKWRVYAYQKMLGPIRSFKKRIESEEEARSIAGVGDKTAKKIMEIIRTGSLRRISYERTQDVHIVLAFQGIYGVGQKTAYQWYANGCRSLDDVREGKFGINLSAAQQIGLKFYDDINSRMPRNEAGEIFEIIKEIALQMDPHLFIEIMGSYRRGKDTCGDIDILITRPTSDGKTHAGLLARLMDELHSRQVITEDLSVPDDWNDLELCYRGLCRRDAIGKRRRIDFLAVPYESRGAALLYYTGDDIFNRSMRLKANKMGYSLNQRGLYKDVIRDPTNRQRKLHGGTILASETEREIFDILGVPWQEPHERVRS